MECHFNVQETLCRSFRETIAIINGELDNVYSKKDFIKINNLINQMGYLSAKSQGLKGIITNGDKFFGSNQKIYIKCEGKKCIGFLKVGIKALFIYNITGEIIEINPLCVLDFYIHESCQRSGYGKELFNSMLKHENLEPRDIGYDRPSDKFISFLSKHFNLTEYVPQNNNYVVFNDYFTKKRLNTQFKQPLCFKVPSKDKKEGEKEKENTNTFNSTDSGLLKNKTFASFKKFKSHHSRSSSCIDEDSLSNDMDFKEKTIFNCTIKLKQSKNAFSSVQTFLSMNNY